MTLRNDIMYLKPRDALEQKAGGKTGKKEGWPKYIPTLQARVAKVPANTIQSWFELLKTDKLAAWACDMAQAMMTEIADLIPDGIGQPAGLLKETFRPGGAG